MGFAEPASPLANDHNNQEAISPAAPMSESESLPDFDDDEPGVGGLMAAVAKEEMQIRAKDEEMWGTVTVEPPGAHIPQARAEDDFYNLHKRDRHKEGSPYKQFQAVELLAWNRAKVRDFAAEYRRER